ncbi:MAG: hypothetical protein WKG07_45840 [Hymenobacter sp.]
MITGTSIVETSGAPDPPATPVSWAELAGDSVRDRFSGAVGHQHRTSRSTIGCAGLAGNLGRALDPLAACDAVGGLPCAAACATSRARPPCRPRPATRLEIGAACAGTSPTSPSASYGRWASRPVRVRLPASARPKAEPRQVLAGQSHVGRGLGGRVDAVRPRQRRSGRRAPRRRRPGP